MEVLPKGWKEWWKKWDIRMFVLISLTLQVFLIVFSSLRKKKASKRFSLFIWSFYLLADWVAAFALGLLCSSQNNDSDCPYTTNSPPPPPPPPNLRFNAPDAYNDMILAFWAPFLLLHLGGPDTITAFAMEDNELWPRHLLGLLFEVGAAFYVFLLALPKTRLLYATLLMFLAGIIKYAERTYALYLASLDGFRGSMLKKPDPGPNYAKLMEEYVSKIDSGLQARIVISPENVASIETLEEGHKDRDLIKTDVEKARMAHKFFDKFKGLIVELIFSFNERNESSRAFQKWEADDAFRVVEFELSFVYDVLFTKAAVIHSHTGYVLRVICSISIFSAFALFLVSNKHGISGLDLAISYTLLGGAMCLDVLAFVMLLLSYWTIVKLENRFFDPHLPNFLIKLSSYVKVQPKDQWSVKMTQHNLIYRCLPPNQSCLVRIANRPTICGKIDELLRIQGFLRRVDVGTDFLDELQYTWREGAEDELKRFIYGELMKKAKTTTKDPKEARRMCSCRGGWALEQRGRHSEFGYSVEVELDESLLTWHIATDLCYYTDEDGGNEESELSKKISKQISDYMVYLLVMRPFMMSSAAVIGKIRYRDTCEETTNFFLRRPVDEKKLKPIEALRTKREDRENEIKKMKKQACENLLSVNTDTPPAVVKGDRSKSVLFDACILAKRLNKLKVKKKWEIMSEVWAEMLAYAASTCPGIAHAQRLSKGGELLTFVWFLMTHLGLGEQYRIEAGHARAKLIVEK